MITSEDLPLNHSPGFKNWQPKGIAAFKQFNSQKIVNFNTKNSGHKIVKALTVNYNQTIKKCNPNYQIDLSRIPKRILTQPSEGINNDNFDNEEYDLIMKVNDIIPKGETSQFEIQDLLGKGTFGQVVYCIELKTKQKVAIKVIKNRPAYYHQAKQEILTLNRLNRLQEEQSQNPDDHRIVKLEDYFVYKKHFCLVFELLDHSLYDLLRSTNFQGLPFELISYYTKQILEGMVLAEKQKIIHCDLKPENILLKADQNLIKVIDFGSACHESQKIYTYIQSRFYRSPEVILGIPYTISIDMWSLGCIVVELFLGLPIFPGYSEYDQLKRIFEILGEPSQEMILLGDNRKKFFTSNPKIEKTEKVLNFDQYKNNTNLETSLTQEDINNNQEEDDDQETQNVDNKIFSKEQENQESEQDKDKENKNDKNQSNIENVQEKNKLQLQEEIQNQQNTSQNENENEEQQNKQFFRFKTTTEYEQDNNITLKESIKYIKIYELEDLKKYLDLTNKSEEEIEEIQQQFNLFYDFVSQLLVINPKERIKASEAFEHPFTNLFLMNQQQEFQENIQQDNQNEQQEQQIQQNQNNEFPNLASLPNQETKNQENSKQ